MSQLQFTQLNLFYLFVAAVNIQKSPKNRNIKGMEQLTHPNIIQILLQDTHFLREWRSFCDALEIPTRELFSISCDLGAGNINMSEVLNMVLESWEHFNPREATLSKFIEILRAEKFRDMAALLEDYKNHWNENLEYPILKKPWLKPPPGVDSVGMKQKCLIAQERLDVGSFSEVFRVRSTFDNRQFALKRICIGAFLQHQKSSRLGGAYEYFRRLLREVVVMAQLPPNPNIVAYQEAWFEGPLQKMFTDWMMAPESLPAPKNSKEDIKITEDQLNTFMYIKMELISSNLANWIQLKSQKAVDLSTYQSITRQILSGLKLMHGLKIVHRDLKPINILVQEDEGGLIAKIADFGLSREISETDTSLTVNAIGCSFSSPEMDRGDVYTFKTDIFSLGLICLVMLEGFKSRKVQERCLEQVRSGDVTIVDNLERKFGRDFGLVRQMLKRNEVDRPTAEEALNQLI